MGLLEFLLIVIVIGALLGRGPLALGLVFDFLIALLFLILIVRLLYIFL